MYYQVGQSVVIDGDSSFCFLSTDIITFIEDRFDEMTGHKYQLITCKGNQQFRSDTGDCVKGGSMYYLVR